MNVAVYGTLKEGYGNYLQFLPGAKPKHALFVSVPYRMYECETYPIVVASPKANPIFVEVFEVDAGTLSRLDELEAPYSLHRETVYLAELDLEIEIYVYDGAEPPADFTSVDSGDWKGRDRLGTFDGKEASSKREVKE